MPPRALKIGIAGIVVLSLAFPMEGQQTSKPTGKKSGGAVQSPATPFQPVSNSSSLPLKGPSPATPSTEYPADYIPCVFTLRELLGLRLRPVSATLTSGDEEDLKELLISEVTAQVNDNTMSPSMKSAFIELVASTSFEGLTPSQALAKVISILQQINAEEIPVEQLAEAAKAKTVAQLVNLVKLQLPMGAVDPIDLPIVQKNLAADLSDGMSPVDRVIQLAANASAALSGVKYSYYEFVVPLQTLTRNLQAVAKDLNTEAQTGGATNNAADQLNAQNIAIQAIVESARKGIAAAFERPQDVGCAMSILSWNETRYAFGKLIANEYIGVQVVVRNLNDKQEFSLHDAELSVDTDINGRYGRFYSGRDKLIVRGLSLAQADYTPRNFVVHIADAVGTVMSAALPVAGNMFKDAVGVYNGGFLPGFKTVWTDHSVDQLNLLSDIGFSSSTNYKTVVPKSGSVMFVIFIPSKQFEEGWWVQSCAEHISIPSSSTSSASSNASAKPSTSFAPPSSSSLSPQPQAPDVGVDLPSVRELCRKYGKRAGDSNSNDSHNNNISRSVATTSEVSGQTSASTPQGPNPPPRSTANSNPANSNQGSVVLSLDDVPYRKWSPTSLSIFRELAWAVVAGTHIQEVQNASAVTQLKCPADDVGNIVFNKTGTMSCDVTGEGLDKIATLRLRDAQDATDTETADGPVTVSGDATKAKVTFQLSKLGGLNKPAYKVYSVTTTGVETFANQIIHFDLNPFVTDLTPATADPSKQSSMVFTVKGFHLDKIAKVQLYEGTYKPGTTPLLQYDPDSGATASQAAFTVKATDDDLKKKATEGSGQALTVQLSIKNSSSSPVGGGSISLKSTVLLSPESLAFDAQNVKTTSGDKILTLTNSGATALTDFAAKLAGTNPTDFSETNSCGASIAAGAKCDFTVKFAPTSAGKLAATLSISYTEGGSQQSQSVSLSGTGKVESLAATVTVSPKTLAFMPQNVKTSSGAKVLTLTNSGATALTNFTSKLAGTNPTDFSETSSCGAIVAAGAKCDFTVKFAPTSIGKLAATLSISYTEGKAQKSQSVRLTGTGQ
jgi:hypothetical protein